MLEELARREKSAGIKPDEDLDIFMKVGICLIYLLSDSANLDLLIFCYIFYGKLLICHIVLQASALGGQETSLIVEYILKVCSTWT